MTCEVLKNIQVMKKWHKEHEKNHPKKFNKKERTEENSMDAGVVQSHKLVVCTVQGSEGNIKKFVDELTAPAGVKGCDVEVEKVK